MSLMKHDDLTGGLSVAPGQPCPHNLISGRRDWAFLLTRGVPATYLSSRLGSLFSLCGQAHRLCADMAVTAALGRSAPTRLNAAHELQQETLREHVRRITLDWPEQLATGSSIKTARQHAHATLQQCPLFGTTEPDLRQWLATHLLGLPAQEWLRHWERDPAAWLRTWCDEAPVWLAGLLRQARPLADRPTPAASHLRVHASEASLMVLADDLVRQPAFSRQPLWRGQCAETGPWTRLHQAIPEVINTPWLRLGSRLAELVQLALTDEVGRSGASWLAMGSMGTTHREGLAWVEMARGLLLHHVQLEGNGDQARVAACHVLAPTEWNFHPQGAVAQALALLPATRLPGPYPEVDLLFSAYDPCVKHEIITPTQNSPLTEVCHA